MRESDVEAAGPRLRHRHERAARPVAVGDRLESGPVARQRVLGPDVPDVLKIAERHDQRHEPLAARKIEPRVDPRLRAVPQARPGIGAIDGADHAGLAPGLDWSTWLWGRRV